MTQLQLWERVQRTVAACEFTVPMLLVRRSAVPRRIARQAVSTAEMRAQHGGERTGAAPWTGRIKPHGPGISRGLGQPIDSC